MNIIFVSTILDQNNNPISQIISSVPSVIIAAIANSKILDQNNTSHGLYVIDCSEAKGTVASEIERFLKSNTDTQAYKKGVYKGGTIWFEW